MSSRKIKDLQLHKYLILAFVLLFVTEGNILKAMADSGPFAISSIAASPASSCAAADGTITITIDAASPGTSPYDVSLDNGSTWVETNLVPNAAGEISVTNQAWGTYALAVRDATSAVIYPGYAQVTGCTIDVGRTENPTFSINAVSGATGYTWTTTAGSITSGQNTTSVTFDFSSLALITTGTICAQPTGPTCTAPATCFDFRVVAISPACTIGVDTDNDGVSDICDLDDDNDGILDLEESKCSTSSIVSMGAWDNNLTPFERGTIWNPALIASIENEVFGSGISVSESSTTLTVSGIDQPNYSGAVAANDYIEFAFTTQPNINSLFLRSFFYTKNSFAGADEYGYSIALAYSDDGFSTSQIVVSNYTIDTYVSGSQQDIRTLVDDNFASISANTTYTFRLYFYNKTTPGPARFDDFALESGQCTGLLDTDGDGIPNNLDLDSDNDGIFDAYEAGHGASVASNGRINGADTGSGVNGYFDGIETSADSGVRNYSISDSEPSSDGIYDAYDLDSDGDGCVDTAEESISDTDKDGIVGNGTPSVDGNGLVTSVTYSPPANNRWQNPSTSSCYYIEGSVFEDINYGGGAGRHFGAANTSATASGWNDLDIGIENCRVELYSSVGAFMEAVNTNASGVYRFDNVLTGDYTVRFVTRAASSNRASNGSGSTAYSVPVYRSVNSTTFTNEVGGVDPTREDALANTTGANLSSLTAASTVAQAVSNVTVTAAPVSDVDLGLSFNVVTNTNNAGIGSLRQFILNSNELNNTNLDQEDNPAGRPVLAKALGEDVSIFEIPGAGPHTIALTSVLPDVEDTHTHLSGYTQQGSVQGLPESRTINIGVNGAAGSFDGLRLQADNLTVSGLSLYRFIRAIEVVTSGVSETYIWGNYIGLEPDGTTTATNTSAGIQAQNQTNVIVGTNGDGINDLSEGNVVADSYEGVNFRACSNSMIAGNYIGIDRTGVTDAGNRYHGIHLRDCSGRNVVGLDDNISTLTATAARNVSSGNRTDGIRLSSSSNQVVAGNFFGTDRTGTIGIVNGGYGLQFITAASNNQVGTDSDNVRDAEERNVISGNGAGLRFVSGSTGSNNWIAGNYIGVDVTGNVALPNLNNGVELTGNQSNTIVGTNGDGIRDVNERNVISGNREDGIRIGGTAANLVAGNYIGVGADPTISVPNQGRGIIVSTVAAHNTIGYSPSMANSNPSEVGNIIRGNGDCGIALAGTGTNNRLSRNNYGNHTNLAIDLDYDLVSINDNGDGDTGPNNMLNYPVLNYSKVGGTTLRIKGFAPAGATVEFYIADAGPTPGPTLPSGYTSSFGEGYTYLASAVEGSASDSDASTGTYTDDGSGTSTVKTQQKFSFDIPVASLNSTVNIGDLLTAISIDASGNTSEFSGVMQARFIEICDDLIDNDGDGEIDCEDDDCPNVLPVATVSN